MTGLRFLLAGGGTSGHITPALAIADQICADHPDAEIRFCGTERGLESILVPRAGYSLTTIRASGLPSKPSPALFRAAADFWAGRRQCRRILFEFQPNAVIGTGGYVCSPVIAAAAGLRIPVILHEQNAFPGRSNRLMARKSQAVCISFPGTETRFPAGTPVFLTGNPVRGSYFALTRDQARSRLAEQGLAITGKTNLVLMIGGSLGSRTINQAVLAFDPDPDFWSKYGSNLLVVLAAGHRQYSDISHQAAGKTWLDVREYIHDLDLLMAAADLVVSRSGAMTCAELAALGRPSILVPYPYAAGDHQTFNARALADAGASILCPDSEMSAGYLNNMLPQLLNDPVGLERMGRAAAKLARPDAARAICQKLYEVMM
ncbi:MAG: undecaprenyldiphospho-muramoylpentapeptide beta-N-acetylglucosaminyltransferase [Clostridiaceae bacterium]|nr:undecaprenyldiphospho-muramoylpentapeptide beta-N-acetylglucosaminyltransferase [Clostridiaceae bacterium]